MDKNSTKITYRNAKWQIPVPYGNRLYIPPTSYLLIVINKSHTKTKKSLFLNEQCWRIYFLGETSGEWTINRKITKTERAAAYMETDRALYMLTLPLTLNQFTSCACVRCLHY